MRKLPFILAALMAFLASGCFNVFEELSLNKDGSGTYSMKMDLSQFMSDDFMKNMLREAINQESAASSLSDLEQDSLILFKSLPEELKARTGRPEFWDNVTMRLKVSDKDDEFYTITTLQFKDLKDIDFFHKNVSSMLAENGAGGLLPGDVIPGGASFRLGKNMITRLPAGEAKNPEMEGEEMEMLKLLMSDSKFTTTYNLPGMVRKTTIPGAKVSGSTVKVETDLISMMEGKGKTNGEIRFK
jgi:hypothetical protein